MKSVTLTQKFFHFSVVKIIVGIICCVGIVTIAQIGMSKILTSTSLTKDERMLLIGIVVAILSIATYTFLFKYYEKRSITELSTKVLGKNLSIGILLGVVLQSLTILVIYLNKGFTIISVNSILFILPSLTMAFTSAIFEEILFRGIIFRITEEKLGSYWALAISAIIFGAMHLANPHSTILAALGLAIQAGLLLGAAYIFSKNLWFPIAIHFAWNFTQSGIYGVSTSGNNMGKSLLTTKIEGATWFTGGQFGPEGSIQATLFCLVATIVLVLLSKKHHKIVKPFKQVQK
ncbi:MAG: CPBP family intramembrane glutamic endopeptidase [Ferruginibacter sp.]